MERSTDYQRPIYMCFIDYSKAFDCVDHTTLWNIMEEMGIPEHMVEVIMSLYANQEANYEQNTVKRRAFRLGKVSDTGGLYVFNLYSEYIMLQANLEEIDT